MKKPCIFTPSTSLMREPMLATKAGIFIFRLEGEFTPIIRRPAITERLRSVPPAQVDLLTAVFGGPLFCPPQSTGRTMEITTPQGKVILIDDEDYHLVKGFKWIAMPSRKNWYARTANSPGITMHRLLMKPKSGMLVDHINGNGLDNRRDNLRLCTIAENNRNRGLVRTNTTGFQGVAIEAKTGKFRASIRQNGKTKNLGLFDCPFKAARAYDAAARELHGEFANTNFPITG